MDVWAPKLVINMHLCIWLPLSTSSMSLDPTSVFRTYNIVLTFLDLCRRHLRQRRSQHEAHVKRTVHYEVQMGTGGSGSEAGTPAVQGVASFQSQGNPKPLPSSHPLCAGQLKELEASRKHWQEWMCSRAPSPGQGREATVCPQPSRHCHVTVRRNEPTGTDWAVHKVSTTGVRG